MNLTVVNATNADAGEIKQMIFSVLREYGLQPDSAGTDLDLEDIELQYANNGGYFGVARWPVEQGHGADEVVASVGIRRVDEKTCELRKMYMLPRMRGRGFGKQLLELALSTAGELGYQRVILETASPLREAIALYRKYGFREFHPPHLSNRCDKAFELDLKARYPVFVCR